MVKLVMKLVVMVVAEMLVMEVVVVVLGGSINATTTAKIKTKHTSKHKLITLNQKCHPYNSHHHQYGTITTDSPA